MSQFKVQYSTVTTTVLVNNSRFLVSIRFKPYSHWTGILVITVIVKHVIQSSENRVKKWLIGFSSQARITDTQWRHKSKICIWKIGPMWQTKYASAAPKNLELGLNFWPCSEGYSSLGVRSPCSQASIKIKYVR